MNLLSLSEDKVEDYADASQDKSNSGQYGAHNSNSNVHSGLHVLNSSIIRYDPI